MSMRHALESTKDFFDQIENEMSYSFRYERVPEGRKLEIVKYNGKKDVSLVDWLGDKYPTEPFEVLIIEHCVMTESALKVVNQLVSAWASPHLWRVHFHRSSLDKPCNDELGILFDSIRQKPLVELKLDNLSGFGNLKMLQGIPSTLLSSRSIN